jgi:hypothetical protein
MGRRLVWSIASVASPSRAGPGFRDNLARAFRAARRPAGASRLVACIGADSETHSPRSRRIWQPTVVGRKSREKLRRRVDSNYKAQVEAIRAEQKGRLVPPTPDSYERAAHAGGPSAVVEALIARHNMRWANKHPRGGPGHQQRNGVVSSVAPAGTGEARRTLPVWRKHYAKRMTEWPSGLKSILYRLGNLKNCF